MAENSGGTAKRRGAGNPFRAGMSGNPGGRPKVIAELRDLARQHTRKAIGALVKVMQSGESDSAQVAAANASGKAQRGDISIACVPTGGDYLPRIIREYSARYSKILDHLSPGVTEAVLSREAEFGIRQSGLQHPELSTVPLLHDRYVLICRNDHPLAHRKKIPWKQLDSFPLIFPSHIGTNGAQLDAALSGRDVALQPYGRSSDTEASMRRSFGESPSASASIPITRTTFSGITTVHL